MCTIALHNYIVYIVCVYVIYLRLFGSDFVHFDVDFGAVSAALDFLYCLLLYSPHTVPSSSSSMSKPAPSPPKNNPKDPLMSVG